MDLAVEERADRQHDRARRDLDPGLRHDAAHPRAVEQQAVDVLLQQREVRLCIEQRANRALVENAIGLGARRAYGRALARVQDPEMDPGAVDRARHRAAERVDLLREMTFADPADRGIAAHRAESLEVLGEQQRAATQARRGERGLRAGVAAADHDAVVTRGVVHCATDFRVSAAGLASAARGA